MTRPDDYRDEDRQRADRRIDRLTIRCHAHGPSAGTKPSAVKTVESRTRQAEKRLRHIANSSLPAKLDRLLPPGDHVIEKLSVPLSFSLDDHDDETIAWLWASAVAAEARNYLDQDRQPSADDVADVAPAESNSRQKVEGFPGSGLPPIPRPDGGKFETTIASRSALLNRLVQALGKSSLDPAKEPMTLFDEARERQQGSPNPESLFAERESEFTSDQKHQDKKRQGGDKQKQPPSPDVVEDATKHLALEELENLVTAVESQNIGNPNGVTAEPGLAATAASDQPQLSNVGGLVLLYPWLKTVIEKTWTLHGESTEAAMATLLALCTADDAEPPDSVDPLLRMLAGCQQNAVIQRDRIASFDLRPLADDFDDIYRCFSATLGGSWTRSTLVGDVIVRTATLERNDRTWILQPSPRPLDLLLGRLPYPISYFGFPWTDPIIVRWPHES